MDLSTSGGPGDLDELSEFDDEAVPEDFDPFAFENTLTPADSEMAELFDRVADAAEDDRQTPEVTDEDYEPETRWIVMRLKRHIKVLTSKGSSQESRWRAVQWLFVNGAKDAKGVSFHLSCEALSCRPEVVQLRTMYELWLRDAPLHRSLPLLSDRIPAEIGDMVFHAFPQYRKAEQVAADLWQYPGMPFAEAVEACRSHGQAPQLLDEMIARGVVGVTGTGDAMRCFLIGANPTQLSIAKRRVFTWPMLFT